MSGDAQITELWSTKFDNKRAKVLDEVNTSVTEVDLVSFSVDVDTVSRSISKLKPRKSDSISDHVWLAPHIFASKLAGPLQH